MKKGNAVMDPRIIEAEENLLIDFQTLLHELIVDKGLSRAELCKRTGLSPARLSQVMSAEANPTVKTMARLFHALGENVCLSRKSADGISVESKVKHKHPAQEWQWNEPNIRQVRVDHRLVAVIKDTGASNDNYNARFMLIDSELALEAA